ncbi:gamma-glutamyl-gamma-aminobutyrate hydrolase, partial [Limosilactobacillus reuteri]
MPLVLPISDPQAAAAYVSAIDKLLLTGGQDIDPVYYGENPHQTLGATNPARDAFEIALFNEAVKQSKPVLANCRGMQLMNVAFGGSLYQDWRVRPQEARQNVQVPTSFHFPDHSVTIGKDSLLGAFLPENYRVNSFHHQTVKVVGQQLRVIAQAEDGVIEAIENQERRLLG